VGVTRAIGGLKVPTRPETVREHNAKLFPQFSCLRIEIRVPHIKRLLLRRKSALEGWLCSRNNPPTMRFFIGENCSYFLTLAIAKNSVFHRLGAIRLDFMQESSRGRAALNWGRLFRPPTPQVNPLSEI